MDNLGAMVVLHLTHLLPIPSKNPVSWGLSQEPITIPGSLLSHCLRCRSLPAHLQTFFCFASLRGGTGMENTHPKPTKTSSSKGCAWFNPFQI